MIFEKICRTQKIYFKKFATIFEEISFFKFQVLPGVYLHLLIIQQIQA